MPGGDSYSAPGLPVVVDRTARNRVLSWLSHEDSGRRQPAADCVMVLQSVGAGHSALDAPKADPEVVDSPASLPAPTARQKVALLWKKCEQTLSQLFNQAKLVAVANKACFPNPAARFMLTVLIQAG